MSHTVNLFCAACGASHSDARCSDWQRGEWADLAKVGLALKVVTDAGEWDALTSEAAFVGQHAGCNSLYADCEYGHHTERLVVSGPVPEPCSRCKGRGSIPCPECCA